MKQRERVEERRGGKIRGRGVLKLTCKLSPSSFLQKDNGKSLDLNRKKRKRKRKSKLHFSGTARTVIYCEFLTFNFKCLRK